MQLTWAQVRMWRQHRHHLDRRVPSESWPGVVTRLCGLHAQLLSSADLSLWARVEQWPACAIQDALWKDRSLVKMWAMRGTLHLLPAAEFSLWQAALGTYKHFLQPSWLKYFGVSGAELEQLIAAIAQVLQNQVLTREQLASTVGDRLNSPELGAKLLQSWGSLLKPATYRGHLCFAPGIGQNVCFTHPVTWLRSQASAVANPMLEVTRRYLAAYGPATRESYAHWWGMSRATAQTQLKRLGQEVTAVEVDGQPAWMLTDHVQEIANLDPVRSVRLLPAFDPYVIAASPLSQHFMPGEFRQRIYRPQGWLSPVLLVNGRMDGIWNSTRKGRSVHVEIEPFTKLPRWAKTAAADESERLAHFLTGSGTALAELTWKA